MKKTAKIFNALAIIILVSTLAVCYAFLLNETRTEAAASRDAREDAHGMNYVIDPETDQSYLIWTDEYLSGTSSDGSWTHNIYYQSIDINNPKIASNANKLTLISAPEAQEPASASFSKSGSLIVTFEDGNKAGKYTLAQRYAIYKSQLKDGIPTGKLTAVKKYNTKKTTILMGGHSGHASSTDTKHVVFYSEGWINGGGVNGLGTGNDVRVCTISGSGKILHQRKVAVGNKTRDWWPVTASSSDRSLLVWQRYVKKHTYSLLCFAVYDPDTNKIISKHIKTNLHMKYYSYNAVYLKNIDRYLISFTQSDGSGTLLLVDQNGNIAAVKKGLPSFVREASPAVYSDSSDTAILCFAQGDRSICYYRVTKNSITHTASDSSDSQWSYRGTSGFFDSDISKVSFATLGRHNAELYVYSVPDQAKALSSKDRAYCSTRTQQ